MKPTVLFVDDAPNILSGLRRNLRAMRNSWGMAFAESGAEAMMLVKATKIDVIVSDMQMPVMNGAELLALVAEASPTTIRFVLSGEASEKSVPDVVRTAHQFLTKPCETSFLIERINRALDYRMFLQKIGMEAEVVGAVGLKISPEIYDRFVALREEENPSADTIVDLMKKDIALVGKILQIANSGFFAGHGKNLDLRGAIHFLQPGHVLELISEAITPMDAPLLPEQTLVRENLAAHSIECGSFARVMAAEQQWEEKEIEAVYTTGILHNIGRNLEMAMGLGNLGGVMTETDPETNESFEVPYYIYLGIGLLGIWGFRKDVLLAIQYHLQPSDYDAEPFDILTFLHVAHALSAGDEIDENYLEKAGQLDSLAEWQAAALGMQSSKGQING